MCKIIEKYKGLSAAVKASLWFMICNVVQKGIAFLVVPIYTRMLTTAEYGTYSVFLSWTSIIYIFATLNMSAGVFNNGMIKYEHCRDDFTSSVQGLSSVLCVLCVIVLIIFYPFWSEILDLSLPLIIMMMIQIFFQAPYNYWMAKKRFEFKYRSIVFVTLFLAISIPILSISLMRLMSDRTLGIIIGSVAMYSVIGAFIFIFNYKNSKKFFDKEIWKYCLKFNIPLIPHYLSYVILGQADRVMINSICGASDAGIYALAYQISLVINIVTTAVDGSFNPWTYQKLKVGDMKSIKRISNCLIGLFAIGVFGLILIAPEVLSFVAPAEYSSAKWVVPPVICGCYFLFIAGTFMRVEFYHEKNKIIMIASVCAAVLNIVLNAIFIPIFGFIAAAYTTLGSYMLFAVFHYFVMRLTCKEKYYDESPYSGKMIFVISLVIMCISVLLMVLYDFVLIRYAIVFIIVISLIVLHEKIIDIFSVMGKRG